MSISAMEYNELVYACDSGTEVIPSGNYSPPAIPNTMPNPATDLILTQSEYDSADPTYVPKVIVTYALDPSTSRYWQCGHIYYAVDRDSGYTWSSWGYDYSRGAGCLIDLGATLGPGDTLRIMVVAVSTAGQEGSIADAPTAYITVATSGTLPTPTGLALETGGSTWKGNKFAVVWDPINGMDPYNVSNEVIVTISGSDRLTVVTRDNRWEYVYGDGADADLDSYMIAANGACTIRVRRISPQSTASGYATLAITRIGPSNPANLTATGVTRGAIFRWDKNTEPAFRNYKVRTRITSGGTWSSWETLTDNTYYREVSPDEITTYGANAAVYIEITCVDRFDNESVTSSTNVAALYLGVQDVDVVNLSADKLNAGCIRGINVTAASHLTKGSYLTAACSGGDGTVYLKDTSDFASSGSGQIIDSTNDRDAFSWTGKTSNSLTGCSSVLAHGSGATVIPLVKGMAIDSNTNEMRFFGDRGDGTIEELASVGISTSGSDTRIISVGSGNVTRTAVYGVGVTSAACIVGGENGGAGCGVAGWSYQGVGLVGNYHPVYGKGPLLLQPAGSSAAPTHAAEKGTLWVTSAGVLYINIDGSTTWQKVGAQ
jgi:hypothetical protein